jgi:hypothetical protein
LRRAAAAAALLVPVALGGCSTHEFHYEGGVPPQPLSSHQRVETADGIVTTLLKKFAPAGRHLPASVAAPLAEAALLDGQATGSKALLETADRLARSLLTGRIPIGVGVAYPGKDGSRPDPLVTAEVARTLLYFDQVTKNPQWRPAAARVVQGMITPRLGWTRLRDGYAVREPGARRRYDIATTADAGLVISKLAAVGGGPLAQRYGRSALAKVRRAQIAPGKWHKSLGAAAPMPVAERALTLYSLHLVPDKAFQDITLRALPGLFTEAFEAWGQPRKSRLVGTRGIGPILALRALYRDPGRSPSEHVTRWFVEHRRPDGTFEDVAPDDAVTHAYFALAFATRAYIYAKGGLP